MIGDVWTVMRKEWKELLNQGSSRLGTFAGLFFTVAVLGVALPLFNGRAWAEGASGGGGGGAYGTIGVIFAVLPMVADAFAGERERRTLETLLASRLSDRAILFGKVGAIVAVGWGLILLTRFAGLVALNLVLDGAAILPGGGWWAATGGALLLCLYLVGVGVLVSLRAPTVKQASQAMFFAAFGPLLLVILLSVLAFVVARLLPAAITGPVGDAVEAGGWIPLVILAGLATLLVPVAPLLLAMRRFRRARLLLD